MEKYLFAKYKLQEKHYIILSLVLFLIIKGIPILQYQSYVQSDDFAYIANAAFFAGNNWNPYTGNMTKYYGVGFSLIPSIFFALFDNSVYVYRALLAFIVILEAIIMFILYKIATEYLHIGKREACSFSFICSYGMMAPQSGHYFLSEVPISLCYILLIFLCLKASVASEKKKVIYSMLLALVLAYSYSIHARFLILAVVLVVVMTSYFFKYKEKMINYIAFILSFIFVFVIVYIWIKYVQGSLYKTTIINDKDGLVLGNEGLYRLLDVPVYIKAFLNLENLKECLLNFMSLMGTFTLLTGGMIWYCIVWCVSDLWHVIKERDNKNEKNVFILETFSILSFFGMNILVAMNGVLNSGYRWLTYYRYSKPFICVFLLIFLWKIKDRNKPVRKVQTIIFVGILVSFATLMLYTTPILENATYIDHSKVGWLRYYFYSDQEVAYYFYGFIQLAGVSSILYYFMTKRKRIYPIMIAFGIYSSLLWYSEHEYNVKVSEENYEMISATEKFMREKESVIDVPIFFLQGTYSGKLRFALYDIEMNYLLENKELDTLDYNNAILLSDRTDVSEVSDNKPMYRIEIDNNQYIYTSNQRIYYKLKSNEE